MVIILSIVALIVLSVMIFISQPKFGKTPGLKRLQRIKQSPNFRDGSFQNLSHTPNLTEGVSFYEVFKEFFLSEKKRVKPVDLIPSMKTDLTNLDPARDILVWFGHSSYFMQLDGKRILVDPVLGGSASPISMTTRSFKGTDVYTVDELPAIDYLFISHDHWDHLDYETLLGLRPRVNR